MSAQDDYSEAVNRFTGLRSNISSLRSRYEDLAQALVNPDNAYVSNVDVSYPRNLSAKGERISGAAELPSMKELGTMLSNYQHAREDLQNKYDAVPGQHRGGLRPPGDI